MLKDSKVSAGLKLAIEEGYTIDTNGTVRNPKGRVLKGSITTPGGYRRYDVAINGKRKALFGHQIQAYMKFGDKVWDFYCIRHMDNCKTNNSWDNLELGTHQDNANDRSTEDRLLTGKNSALTRYKLTAKDVTAIKELLDSGTTQAKAAEIYGVSKGTIRNYVFGINKYVKATEGL